MLTPQQHKLLTFLQEKIATTGICPSFEEMREYLGLKSKSGIAALINSLEKRKFIKRHKNVSRAIEVIRLPESAVPLPLKQVTQQNDTFTDIPFFGEIAAGSPLFDQDRSEGEGSEKISVPKHLCSGPGIHYAIEVCGDSMTDLGIHDGDLAIIERVRTAKDGDVISALVDNCEVTLKTYKRVGDKIHLEPANQDFKTQVYEPERVKIHGRLVSLIRRYK